MKPDNEYLSKLGFAHYAIQGTTWSVVYALNYATGERVGELAVSSQRRLATRLKEVWRDDPKLLKLARSFHQLLDERNHIVHAHPATRSTAGSTGGPRSQRLYRWDVGEGRTGETSWVTEARLDRFAGWAVALACDIQAAWTTGDPR